MSAQHTPGPWVYRRSFDSSARRDIWTAADETGHRELVATIPDADGDHINADARLIAAAPDLLRELQNCVNVLSLALPLFDDESTDDKDSREEVGSVLDAARDALAKAMGGDQ